MDDFTRSLLFIKIYSMSFKFTFCFVKKLDCYDFNGLNWFFDLSYYDFKEEGNSFDVFAGC